MHPTAAPGARADGGDALRQALHRAQRRSGLPVLFGGEVRGTAVSLSEFLGVRTTALRGLDVRATAGLGGRVLVSARPAAVADYRAARSITHDYDGPVGAEGIRSVLAVPVVVSGAVRGVLYGACRSAEPVGDRAVDGVVLAARQLARDLVLRDEIDRRLGVREAAGPTEDRHRFPLEELRAVHAELRQLARTVPDEALRGRLEDAARRLAGMATATPEPLTAPLTPRETDVLAQVALGRSNADAAQHLSLRPETVKAYLRSAMRKLGSHTRLEAVVAARRHGILP